MRVVHIIPSIGYSSFGLGSVALNLVKEQNAQNINSTIWCLDDNNDVDWALKMSRLSENRICNFKVTGPRMLGFSFEMERAAKREENEKISLLHQHGTWTVSVSRTTCAMRDKYKIPVVIAPHGNFEKLALEKSWWKKKLALSTYERNNLLHASCLHACSEKEINGIRDLGLSNPIAVIPNGISKSWIKSTGNASTFREHYDIPKDKRIMLFLSRVTPIKGLLLLMTALHSIREQLKDWIIVIAGADELNHKAEVCYRIKQFNLKDHIYFTGMLLEQAKRDAYAAADFFVLPTKCENFAIVVAEALGAGVPVLTTRGAPWSELVSHQCGWWTDINANAIAEALRNAMKLSPLQLSQMGQRGRKLVETKYTWSESARMTAELYKWLLEQRERPDFVVID